MVSIYHHNIKFSVREEVNRVRGARRPSVGQTVLCGYGKETKRVNNRPKRIEN